MNNDGLKQKAKENINTTGEQWLLLTNKERKF